jgi:RNA polymerase sigma-70 factor (ECF subfamily)
MAERSPVAPPTARHWLMSEVRVNGEGRQPSTGTSRSLLERVKSDEPAAWDRLVALYAPLVYYWCRHWGLPEQDVADVFQEVFQAVARSIAAFRKEKAGDTFRGWLRTITANKVRDHFRHEAHQARGAGGTDALRRLAELPAPEMDEGSGPGEEAAEQALFHRALELIRGEFEERTWQAFWRTTVEGRTPAEVGPELGMSPGAVRVAKSRVLHRLRAELGDAPS